MNRYSRRTLAALAHALSETNSNTEIDALAFELGVETEAAGSNKLAKCLGMVKAGEARCKKDGNDQFFSDLLQQTLSSFSEWQFENSPHVSGLVSSIRLDGFEWRDKRLIPTTPETVTLASQISALEIDLRSAGLNVASRHYAQACDNVAVGNYEAANSQIRSCLEDLFLTLGEQKAGKKFADPASVLQHFRQESRIDDAEWNAFRSFWNLAQSKGPHRGLSNEQESLFRLQVATAICRFVLHRLK